jgi:tetratricopeptide (TPR) repeat protein
MSRFSAAAVLAAAIVTASPSSRATAIAAQEPRRPEAGAQHDHHRAGVPRDSSRTTLLPGLGDWHHPVSTRVPLAQRFFDQGLRLAYGFNHDEAERAFAEAARLDPSCAMCWWGVAYAVSPNINLPMTPEAEERGLGAIRKAQRLTSRATPRERAYIDALARRFGTPAGAERGARDTAYALAMRAVAQRFPDDLDAQVLYADAMLNLRPWNQWTRDGEPQPGTLELVGVLERVIARRPDHAGACHFYVHAVEASATPERALPCAERLPRLMPGAGHVVHMPAHVYLRVGRYADAARSNLAAMAADRRYLGGQTAPAGIYPMFYTRHNAHFLWAAYLLSGQGARALETARTLERSVSLDDARANASLEAFLTTVVLTHARLAAWDSILAQPAPGNDLRYVRGIWHFARGLAHAARGDDAAGAAELDTLRGIARAVPADVIVILNPARSVLELAAEVLAGQLALAQVRTDEAMAHLREAVRREDMLTYDEPPPWYHSSRHMLATAQLAAGRDTEAEATFREDLHAYRENGWSLAGLERALRRQGREAEAAAVATRLATAWRDADVPPISSR